MKSIIKTLFIMASILTCGNAGMEAQQNNAFTNMIAAAIKAPSGHNTQPWKFKIENNYIDVLPDLSATLNVVDGDRRELYISLGTAVENLCIAATHEGYTAQPEILKDSSFYYVHIPLSHSSDVRESPLYASIAKRQTNRSVYERRIITPDTIALLQRATPEKGVHFYFYANGTETFNWLANEIYKGNGIQMSNPKFKEELLNWMRFNKGQAEKEGNGLYTSAMGAPSLPSAIAKPIVKSFLNPKAQNKSDKKKIESSSHLMLITADNNDQESWIAIGRSLERLVLTTTKLGIVNAYENQPCELNILSEELRSQMKDIHNEYPDMLLRLGYSKPMPYAPRRNIDSFIITNK